MLIPVGPFRAPILIETGSSGAAAFWSVDSLFPAEKSDAPVIMNTEANRITEGMEKRFMEILLAFSMVVLL
jgi:hypothetical protein